MATAKKKASAIPAAKLALYEKLIATDASIERKGATIPYTSSNGKMSTYLMADRRASDAATRR